MPAKGCGRFSLPDMKSEVRGSDRSRADPTNCCDSGGKDMESGFMSRTCEVENGKPLNWYDVGDVCSDLSNGVACPDDDADGVAAGARCGGEAGCCCCCC